MTFRSRIRQLAAATSGVAMTEFALGAPFLLMAGLWGAEEANYALVNMKIAQLAIHLADNASRIGDTSTLEDRKIYESDINDLLYGAQLQGGGGLGLYTNGRVIISSLEVDETEQQYIHWQRCRGAKNVNSTYGNTGDRLRSGMGPTGAEVLAQDGEAVIFVEINYTYIPLVSERFIGNRDIRSISSFTVRDSRDLSQIYQRDSSRPDPVQHCSGFHGDIGLGKDGVIASTSSTSGSSSGWASTSGSSSTTSSSTSSGASSSGGTTGSTSSTTGGSTTGSSTTGGSTTGGTTSGGSTTSGSSSTTTTSGGTPTGGRGSGCSRIRRAAGLC